MSEVTNDSGAVGENAQSAIHSGGNSESTDSVGDVSGLLKHKEKLLGENKKLKQQMAELQRIAESAQQEKLQAEGKKDELIQSLKKEKELLNQKVVGTHSAFATRVIHGELKAEAAKSGCVSLEDFVRLVDIESIEVDDNYNPDPEKVKALVQDAMKNKPYLFSKSAPNINSKLPGSGDVSMGEKEDFSKLSSKELLELAHKRAREGRK
jgi:hypothetical protein